MPDTPETIKFDLTKPLVTHSGAAEVLNLRRPTLGMLVAAGAPYTFTQTITDEGVTIRTDWHWPAVASLLSAMSGHDTMAVDDLDGGDAMRFSNRLLSLLQGEA